ncbi:MAG: cupin domain-containing protein [Thermoguttaceae bacterium]|jgi:cupin 2 domain-containing protein
MKLSLAENLFDNIPAIVAEEMFTTLFQANDVRIERIVSEGHASPPEFWCDQDRNEWVMVLEGSAAVQFDRDAEPVTLRRGSYLNIPAHAKHRVVWTDPSQKTVWLAIHYRKGGVAFTFSCASASLPPASR